MGFLSKVFKKGTIIESKQCIHIKSGKIKGYHMGIVNESDKNETIFHIFTHSKKSNTPVDFSKFSNDFGKKRLDNETYISDKIFKNKTKDIKRPKGGGKYNV